MYSVDEKDKIIELKTLPQSSVGAPTPLVLSNEHRTIVAYYLQDENYNSEFKNEPIAIVTFKHCLSVMFGPPNDEAFRGHPLASRGLSPYSFFLVENSSWLRTLEKMNSVHPYHSQKLFEDYKHFVLSFHDSVLECISEQYDYEVVEGPILNVVGIMKERLSY